MEKNKELHEKKFALRNELVQQRKIMGALQPSDEEKKLNNDLSAYNTRLQWALQSQLDRVRQKSLKEK